MTAEEMRNLLQTRMGSPPAVGGSATILRYRGYGILKVHSNTAWWFLAPPSTLHQQLSCLNWVEILLNCNEKHAATKKKSMHICIWMRYYVCAMMAVDDDEVSDCPPVTGNCVWWRGCRELIYECSSPWDDEVVANACKKLPRNVANTLRVYYDFYEMLYT